MVLGDPHPVLLVGTVLGAMRLVSGARHWAQTGLAVALVPICSQCHGLRGPSVQGGLSFCPLEGRLGQVTGPDQWAGRSDVTCGGDGPAVLRPRWPGSLGQAGFVPAAAAAASFPSAARGLARPTRAGIHEGTRTHRSSAP